MTEDSIFPADDPWLVDLIIAAIDGDMERAGELVLANTGGDQDKMLSELTGGLLSFVVNLGERLAGGRDEFRAALRETAVLQSLEAITTTP